MKIVVYCNIWKDGLGDFGHFKDIVDRLLESYDSSIEITGLVIYDSNAHNLKLLEQDLQRYNTLPRVSWRLLDNPTRKEKDNCLLQFKGVKGIIVASTPFYYSDNPTIQSLPILYFPEHEAASFDKDHRQRISIDFDNLIFYLFFFLAA